MTQTTTVTYSTAYPTNPVGVPVTTVLDNAILAGVWSTPITVVDQSFFTATPGSGGTILVQFSTDGGTTWINAAAQPYSAPFTGGVPPTATKIRATATVATATLSVSTPATVSLVGQDSTTGGVYGSNGPLATFVTGLSTTNSAAAAAANYTLLKASIDRAGLIYVPGGLGNVNTDRTIEVPSYTILLVGEGTYIRRPDSVPTFHLFRNRGSHGGAYVNGATISGGLMTVTQPGHPYVAGDVVYNEGYLTNTSLNGPQTVVSAIPGVSWTFAASGVAPTNSSTQLLFTSRYNPLAGANFSRVTGTSTVTVLEAGHKRGVGDRVYIAGLGGANTFNGAQEITGVTYTAGVGVSWTYTNAGASETATGTAQLLGDRQIEVRLSLDGNSDNTSGGTQWHNHLSNWGNISNLVERYDDSRFGQSGRVTNHYNAADVSIPYAASSVKIGVLVQFDSFCDRCNVAETFGDGALDDILAWGVTLNSGPFADTSSPVGPGNMGTLSAGSINGKTITGLLKLYCGTGYNIGKIKIGRITGNGPITVGDPSTGVTGGSIISLTIDDVDNVPDAANAQVVLGSNAWTTLGQVRLGRVKDNALENPAVTAATAPPCVNIFAPADSIVIGQYISKVARSAASHILCRSVTTLKVLSAETTDFGGSIALVECTGLAADALVIDNWTHISSTQSGFGYLASAAGYARRVLISNFYISSLGAACQIGSGSGSLTHTWALCNGVLNGVGSGVTNNAVATINVSMANVDCQSVGNNLLQFNINSTVVNFNGTGVKAPAGKWCLFLNTTTMQLNCREMQVDMTATQIAPQPGDLLYNTNGAFGTGVGLYGRTSAPAWAKLF